MAMANYPSSSKRPFSDVEVEVVGDNKKKRNLYQLFISHRGPEPKHLLAQHMYRMLKDRGFEVFLDVREMEAGGDIPHQIWEAISTSAVQIAIISPGFAESVWCLKELVMMMQKHTDGSSLVIPVFYGVEPADLRFHKDDVPFCQKFRNKHVERQSHETMVEWKEALKELADLSGFLWDEHKGKLVELLVERICTYTHHHHLHIPSYVIGIEKLDETMEDIMKPQGKVTVVSITGIGGIGKTTFAAALFNNMCSHFERQCFVDDVKGLLEKYGAVHIQNLLLKDLLNLDNLISNSRNGQYELKNRLSNQSVLLVLDNIDESVRLNEIFIEDFAILSPSSIVIITSRVTCVFKNDYKIIPVEIPKLDFQKSERLFCSQAFGDDESKIQEEHHILVRQIVQKCDGLPLALVLFGSHISQLDASCWKEFLEMHRDSLPSNLSGCLQITYDSLDDLQKRLFLDVAIFFHGEEVSIVRNLWDDRAPQFKISLNMLKRKLLVEVTEKDCFRMHDILRDLGRTIVDNEDKLNPGCRSRLWREEDIVSVLSEGRGTDKVEALSLVSEGSVIWHADEDGEPCPWKVDAFSIMPSLKMLFLQGRCIEGDLSRLPNGLEFLRWTEFPFDAISIPLKFAKVIDFSSGRQKHLWDLQSMESPMKLRELRLNQCFYLQEIFWDRKFRLLKCLDLFGCQCIKKLPDSFGQLTNLQDLCLRQMDIETLPDSFGQLTNLQKLDLFHNKELKTLPDSFGQLTNLQKLDLSWNWELKRLPESFGRLRGLEVLNMKGCTNLEMLPENFGQLKNLSSKFSLSENSKLKNLPESFGDLQQLQNLDLSHCSSLEMLPDSLGQLTNLQELDLSWNKELKKLTESFGKLHRLKVLNMASCYNLEMLPKIFGQLKNLKSTFSLYGCKKLKKLPESFGDLRQLQNLDLSDCNSLEMLPDSFGQLTNLQKLDLSWNGELKKLTESFGKLHRLEVLNMVHCYNLEMLPQNFGQLKNLDSTFSLYGCEKLKKLPESFGDLRQLQDLDLSNCSSLEMLPDSFGQLTNLQKLNLSCVEVEPILPYMGSEKKAPESFGKSHINLSRTSKLKNLPESFGDLRQLQNLDLSYCTSLETLPDSFGQLINLQKLDLSCNKELKTLPDSFGQLTNLQRLDLDGNKELKRLPESFGKLYGLEVLNMEGCRNLEMLPESFGKLHGLEFLNMEGCYKLEMLLDIFGHLTNLRFLKINNCRIVNIVRGGPLQRFHALRITEAWPISMLVLMEDNPESRPVLSRILNNHLRSNSYGWLEELPLCRITIMDGYMFGLLPCFKVKGEITSKGGATDKCLFFSLKPNPSSSETWVAEGEHCKFKCIGAAICFDMFSDANLYRGPSFFNQFSFGCTKWDPISYTTGGGTSVFCMAVYDSLEEISLDKMSAQFPFLSSQGSGGWVCYFLERDEDLLRHARNSFAMVCGGPHESWN